jgi:hypothetical protein
MREKRVNAERRREAKTGFNAKVQRGKGGKRKESTQFPFTVAKCTVGSSFVYRLSSDS